MVGFTRVQIGTKASSEHLHVLLLVRFTTNLKQKLLLTLESAGFVENLSLLSPFSSNSRTTLSAVDTANFTLLGDQANAVIFAAPSWLIEREKES